MSTAAPTVYIDGQEGTTGLRIRDLLGARTDLEVLLIPAEQRKETDDALDEAERRLRKEKKRKAKDKEDEERRLKKKKEAERLKKKQTLKDRRQDRLNP